MNEIVSKLQSDCKEAVEHYKHELGKLRTGRANPALLDGLSAEYYGTMTPLIQLGTINVPEARTLTIQVFDKGAVDGIMKAIQKADLGVNPTNDGNLIRLNLPSLTEERRKEMVKKLHGMAEQARVAIRNLRRTALEVVKKDKKDGRCSEDEAKRLEDQIQKSVDGVIANDIDKLTATKEKDIMSV